MMLYSVHSLGMLFTYPAGTLFHDGKGTAYRLKSVYPLRSEPTAWVAIHYISGMSSTTSDGSGLDFPLYVTWIPDEESTDEV